MSTKKHHYVPRFYLNLFSSKSDRINIYNISQKLFIEDAGLKDQCYKTKFYGEEYDLENLFGKLESYNATIFQNIINNERLPLDKSAKYANFLAFIATQLLRTAKSAENINTHIDSLTKKLFEEDPRFIDFQIENYKIGVKNPIFFSLSFTPLMIFGLSDLAFQLVFSGNHRFFITSDSPIVKYNQFSQTAKGIGKIGIVSKGLQIFYPLSPHYLLILYDKDIYHPTDGKTISHFINDNDVRLLNLLQFVEAGDNIYFNTWSQKDELNSLAKTAFPLRKDNKHVVDKFYEVGNESTSQLIVQYDNSPNLQLDFSFLKVKRSAQKTPLSKRVNVYRKDLPKEIMDGMDFAPPPDRPILFKRKKTTQ